MKRAGLSDKRSVFGGAAPRMLKRSLLLGGFVIGGLLWSAPVLQAQKPESPDFAEMSLEELMKIRVETVYGASKRLQKVTEAPASIVRHRARGHGIRGKNHVDRARGCR